MRLEPELERGGSYQEVAHTISQQLYEVLNQLHRAISPPVSDGVGDAGAIISGVIGGLLYFALSDQPFEKQVEVKNQLIAQIEHLFAQIERDQRPLQ